MFRDVSRQPGVLPEPVNASQHANWSSVLGIRKPTEAQAKWHARRTHTELNEDLKFLKFINEKLEERIIMISNRHLDESNPTINCDFA